MILILFDNWLLVNLNIIYYYFVYTHSLIAFTKYQLMYDETIFNRCILNESMVLICQISR